TRRLEDNPLSFAGLQVLHHLDYRLNQLGQVGRLAAALAAPAEFQQPLRDRFATKRFLLDHLQVLGDDISVRLKKEERWRIHITLSASSFSIRHSAFIAGEEATFEGLATEGDARQGVVDLVGNAGGEEA